MFAKHRQERRVLWVGVAVALGFLSGCSHTIPLKASVDRPAAVPQMQATIGVYYSPEFKNHEHVGSRSGDRWIFPLGPARTRLFDQTFPILFSSVLPVAGRPPMPGEPGNYVAVIEPRIEAFDFDIPCLKTGTYSAEIA